MQYYAVKIGCLGHHLTESVTAKKNDTNQNFSYHKKVLDKAAAIAVTMSQRIFFAHNNLTVICI